MMPDRRGRRRKICEPPVTARCPVTAGDRPVSISSDEASVREPDIQTITSGHTIVYYGFRLFWMERIEEKVGRLSLHGVSTVTCAKWGWLQK
jgi:hypothetical protein